MLSLVGLKHTWVPTVEYSVQFWGIPTTKSIELHSQSQSESNVHSNSNNNHHNKLQNNVVDSNECQLVGQEENPWVRAQFITNHVENGMLSTDSQIWSNDGRTLLANSRQLAKLLTI